MRASDAAKARWGVFHPEPAPVAALSAGLRARFDPRGVLNPGPDGVARRRRQVDASTSVGSTSTMEATRSGERRERMQTNFTAAQLRDPATARSNRILRTCVHCGFCTATCPTYQVLGDELDSPRGRIYLIKDMLEAGRPADAKTVKHIDRCLSCLACMTTCPSGVHYMHLVDHARAYIERDLPPAAVRAGAALGAGAGAALSGAVPPGAPRGARSGGRSRRLMPNAAAGDARRSRRARCRRRAAMDEPQVFPAEGARRKRVALLTGCAQRVLDPDINAATIRLLTRHGCEVVIAEGAGCCGALTHHMGKTRASHAAAAKNIRAWMREVHGAGLDAIVINTSGCGTTVKDYGHMFAGDPLAADAAAVARAGAGRHAS